MENNEQLNHSNADGGTEIDRFYPREEVYFLKAKKEKGVKILNIFSIIFYWLSRIALVASFVMTYMVVRKKDLFLSIFKSNTTLVIIIISYFVIYEIYRTLVGKTRTRIFKVNRMISEDNPYTPSNDSADAKEGRVYFVKRFLIFDLVTFIGVLIGFLMLFIPFLTIMGEKHSLFTICLDGIKVLFNNCLTILRCFAMGESFGEHTSMFETSAIFIVYATIKTILPKLDENIVFFLVFIFVIFFIVFSIKLILKTIIKIIRKIVYICKCKKMILESQIKIGHQDLKRTRVLLSRIWAGIFWSVCGILIGFICFNMNSNLKSLEKIYEAEGIYRSSLVFLILPLVFIGISLIVYIVKLFVFGKNKVLDDGLWYLYDYKIWLRFKHRKNLKELANQIDMINYNLKEFEKERKRLKKQKLLEKGKFHVAMYYIKRGLRIIISFMLFAGIAYICLAFADYFGFMVMGKYNDVNEPSQSIVLDSLGKMQCSSEYINGQVDGEEYNVNYRIIGSDVIICAGKIEKYRGSIQNGVIVIHYLDNDYYFAKSGKDKDDYKNKTIIDTFRGMLRPATNTIHECFGSYMFVFSQ